MSAARQRLLALALSALAALAVPPPAHAQGRTDEKGACASAAEDAQQLRIDAHLKAARERLLRCARPECPAPVRTDCAQWMSEVVSALPTVVLGARDAQGHDVLAAQASIDGVVVARGLDGKAIEVDPGTHTFRFESGGAAAELAVLIREGEKGRPITAALDAPGAAGPQPAAAATPASASSGSPTPPPGSTTQSLLASPWTWVLGGMGLVALGVGTYLELSVNADASALQSSCGHACSHGQVDPLATRQQILGPIAFGVGALALGILSYTFFAAPASGGGVAGVAGRF